jgi:hypothetical protein
LAYSVDSTPSDTGLSPAIDAVWMFGQMLALSAVIVMLEAGARDRLRAGHTLENAGASYKRSGLSGILILIVSHRVVLPIDAVFLCRSFHYRSRACPPGLAPSWRSFVIRPRA